MTAPLHKYQEEAIDFALQRNGANLFMAPGLGKTRCALEWIDASDARTLVVAPLNAAINTWPAENKKWNHNLDMALLHGDDLHLDDLPHVSLINYEGLPKLAKLIGTKSGGDGMPFDAIIYDEISMLKNAGSKRFGLWRHQMDRIPFRLGLTGTPAGNQVMNLWGEQYCVDLGQTLGRTIGKFKEQHFYEAYEGGWYPRDGAREEIINLCKPTAKAFDTDLLDMPPLILNVKEVDLPESALPWYKEMCDHSTVEALDMIASNAGVKSIKKRQIATGAMYDDKGKIHRLHDAKQRLLKDIVGELQGDPAFIVYDFNHSLEPIASCFRDEYFATINGETKPFKTKEIITEWNSGALHGLAIHPRSAGHGLNLQESGATVIFYDVPWSFELILQALQRVWRQGQKRKVIVHFLSVAGTIEIEVMTKFERNDALHKEVMRILK